MEISETQLNHFRKYGFFFLPNPFGEEGMRQIDRIAQDNEKTWETTDWPKGMNRLACQFLMLGEPILRFVEQPAFVEAARRLLDCEKVHVGACGMGDASKIISEDGRAQRQVEWHADGGPEVHQVAFRTALDRHDPSNAPLRVLPGTHLRPREEVREELMQPRPGRGETLDPLLGMRAHHTPDQPIEVLEPLRVCRVETVRVLPPWAQTDRRGERSVATNSEETHAGLREQRVEPFGALATEDPRIERHEVQSTTCIQWDDVMAIRRAVGALDRVARDQRETSAWREADQANEPRGVVRGMENEPTHPLPLQLAHRLEVEGTSDPRLSKRGGDDHHVEVTDLAEVMGRKEASEIPGLPGDVSSGQRLLVRDFEIATEKRPLFSGEEPIDLFVISIEVEGQQIGIAGEPSAARDGAGEFLEPGQHRYHRFDTT